MSYSDNIYQAFKGTRMVSRQSIQRKLKSKEKAFSKFQSLKLLLRNIPPTPLSSKMFSSAHTKIWYEMGWKREKKLENVFKI